MGAHTDRYDFLSEKGQQKKRKMTRFSQIERKYKVAKCCYYMNVKPEEARSLLRQLAQLGTQILK